MMVKCSPTAISMCRRGGQVGRSAGERRRESGSPFRVSSVVSVKFEFPSFSKRTRRQLRRGEWSALEMELLRAMHRGMVGGLASFMPCGKFGGLASCSENEFGFRRSMLVSEEPGRQGT